ncbi:MAG: ribonuclease P protein subunit [Thaumarchaeota archaeon]|nr:ribonuclease P protein subunit [Nitrososphaerota archaeon]
MNVVGKRLRVFSSSDPTKAGVSGIAVLETAKTILLQTDARRLTVEKTGTIFQIAVSGEVLLGSDMAGRLEDRLGKSLT